MAIKEHSTSIGTVAYQRRGLGDPLLLVHGVYPGASHDEFRHNIDALAKHFTVYAIDLLGFGDSDMPRLTYTVEMYQHLLRDFIVEVVGRPVSVVASGVSCGPVVALAVFNDMLVNRLVLIAPAIGDEALNNPPNLAAKVQQFLLGTLSLGHGLYEAVSSEFELRRFVHSRYANPKRIRDEQITSMHERAMRHHAMHAFVSHMTGYLSSDIPRWLRSVRCEVLILWGAQAGEPPREALLRPAAWSKGKRIEIIPDTAYWPHVEQSAKVNGEIEAFLSQTS